MHRHSGAVRRRWLRTPARRAGDIVTPGQTRIAACDRGAFPDKEKPAETASLRQILPIWKNSCSSRFGVVDILARSRALRFSMEPATPSKAFASTASSCSDILGTRSYFLREVDQWHTSTLAHRDFFKQRSFPKLFDHRPASDGFVILSHWDFDHFDSASQACAFGAAIRLGLGDSPQHPVLGIDLVRAARIEFRGDDFSGCRLFSSSRDFRISIVRELAPP